MLRILLCCGLLFSGNLLAKDIQAVLDWQQRVELGTLVDGMITKVNVMVGQQVSRGSLMIELDQREVQARLAWAESRVAVTKLEQDEARRELDRSLELYDRTLLSNH
jgi:multidrug efflux system membrane fusion protein